METVLILRSIDLTSHIFEMKGSMKIFSCMVILLAGNERRGLLWTSGGGIRFSSRISRQVQWTRVGWLVLNLLKYFHFLKDS